jgi:hypothetical protein
LDRVCFSKAMVTICRNPWGIRVGLTNPSYGGPALL